MFDAAGNYRKRTCCIIFNQIPETSEHLMMWSENLDLNIDMLKTKDANILKKLM